MSIEFSTVEMMRTCTEQDKIWLAADIVLRDADFRAYNRQTGGIASLNECAFLALLLLQDGSTLSELATVIADTWGIDYARAQSDIALFLEKMEKASFIVRTAK